MCKIASSRTVYVWKGARLRNGQKEFAFRRFLVVGRILVVAGRRGVKNPSSLHFPGECAGELRAAPCAPRGACQLFPQVDTDLVGGHPAGHVFLILVDRRPARRALWAPGSSWLMAEDASPLGQPQRCPSHCLSTGRTREEWLSCKHLRSDRKFRVCCRVCVDRA